LSPYSDKKVTSKELRFQVKSGGLWVTTYYAGLEAPPTKLRLLSVCRVGISARRIFSYFPNPHLRMIIFTGNLLRRAYNCLHPPFRKGGKGGFETWKIPLNPPLLKGDLR
jgi:hypothetical protein